MREAIESSYQEQRWNYLHGRITEVEWQQYVLQYNEQLMRYMAIFNREKGA